MITGYTVGGTVGPVASGSALQWGGVLGCRPRCHAGVRLVGGTLVAATLVMPGLTRHSVDDLRERRGSSG